MESVSGRAPLSHHTQPESLFCHYSADASKRRNDVYQSIDKKFQGNLAQLTHGVSTAGISNACFNWWVHWILSPGKQLDTYLRTAKYFVNLSFFTFEAVVNTESPERTEPPESDKRFRSEPWKEWPYNIWSENFLQSQEWLQRTVSDVRGVSEGQTNMLCFFCRQLLDMMAPSNFLLTNPEVYQATRKERGKNLWRGVSHYIEDCYRFIEGRRPVGVEHYKAGENVAISPGKVIYRNGLIELIQYSPTTKTVFPEPILMVSAWIMKYYILDLSPSNSMVKFLVDRGHTVFMISWKNPNSEDRELCMEDYREHGVMAAIDVISQIIPDYPVHAMGYCLGGTMLMIAAAAMARDHDERLASVTLLAAQAEFSEPGELALFIGESEVTFLEAMMAVNGYLDTTQMVGAFQILRSNDLIWSRMVHEYLLGNRQSMNDLMAWNTDRTRMPYRMHSEYLRGLFLHDTLAEGKYMVNGRHVRVESIEVPIFCVGTESDHVAPWKSVYKIHVLAETDVTFLLTSGGHNAGIISEPTRMDRYYRVSTKCVDDKYVSADDWFDKTGVEQGTWWQAWQHWLEERSSKPAAPPMMGVQAIGDDALMDAPGSYIHQA